MGDSQHVFNILFGTASLLAGWWMKAIWDELKDLEKEDRLMSAKLNQLHVLIAGDYVKGERLDKIITDLFEQLDRIEAKVERKMDKKDGA